MNSKRQGVKGASLPLDPGDGLVHVRKSIGGAHIPALCGKTGQSTVSSASGFWGPEGKGWPDVCRDCHRVEFPREAAALELP